MLKEAFKVLATIFKITVHLYSPADPASSRDWFLSQGCWRTFGRLTALNDCRSNRSVQCPLFSLPRAFTSRESKIGNPWKSFKSHEKNLWKSSWPVRHDTIRLERHSKDIRPSPIPTSTIHIKKGNASSPATEIERNSWSFLACWCLYYRLECIFKSL